MATPETPELEKLLAEAKALKERSARLSSPSATQSRGTVGMLRGIAENLSFFRTLAEGLIQGYLGFHERFLAPIWKYLGPPFVWLGRGYGRLWKRFAYRTQSDGTRQISRKRAGLCVGFTLAVLLACTPTKIGSALRFISVEPISDGIVMLASLKHETFYLNHSEEIDPAGNEHSVRGCKHGGQCTEVDAAYFRVKPRLSHDLWKLITQGNPIYVPDHVVAPIAPGVNRCLVTYYGYRMTSSWISRLIRSLEIYPVMLDARCEYLGSQVEKTLPEAAALPTP